MYLTSGNNQNVNRILLPLFELNSSPSVKSLNKEVKEKATPSPEVNKVKQQRSDYSLIIILFVFLVTILGTAILSKFRKKKK